ncbi:MAG: hypothetical protein JO103_04950 [Candidatus Eremiobacteraeota bacterium]|nr:hypothetical protein [Candidatus Eremiobacteraeota bacterium]MBV9408001.1 hypothetical protein [Candidatus Eremiobacteraeota bacterium]
MNILYVDVKYHQQDTPDSCASAVTQMLLGSLHGGDPLGQAVLVPRSAALGVGPRSNGITMVDVCTLLNARKPATFANSFIVCADGDRDVACQRIVDTLTRTRVAVPVLTLGVTNAHCILVTGAVVDPTVPGVDGIRGFFVHNPAPETAVLTLPPRDRPALSVPPEPHTAQDFCGYGRLQGAGDVFVSALTWRRHYWPGPGSPEAPSAYVSITNEAQAVPGNLRTTPRTPGATPPATPQANPTALTDQQAFDAVLKGIADNALATAPPFATVLSSVSFRSAEAHPVGDPFDEAWTLVQLGSALQPLACAFVDGSGAFLSLQAPPAVTPALDPNRFTFLAFQEHAAGLADALAKDQFTLDDVQVADPAWFWQPCRESSSPFYPFRRAKVRGRDVYVRCDGKVFHTLTPLRCVQIP